MSNWKSKLLLIAVASLALAGVASAADLPAAQHTYTKAPKYVPTCTWCGWYVGVNGGGAWGGGKTGNLVDFTPDLALAVSLGLTPSALGANHGGAFGGVQFGYNWAAGNWLVGFEADLQGANIGKTNTTSLSVRALTVFGAISDSSVSTGRDHIDRFGTARGRLGVTLGNVLLYGTGGFAFGEVNASVTNSFPLDDIDFLGSSNGTRFGWVAGGGIEWMFAPNWSLKTEYLHLDLGSSNVQFSTEPSDPRFLVDYRFHHEFDSVRAGVNYHFGGPIVAKY